MFVLKLSGIQKWSGLVNNILSNAPLKSKYFYQISLLETFPSETTYTDYKLSNKKDIILDETNLWFLSY